MIQWQHIEDSIRNKEKRQLKSQKLYRNLSVCVCVCERENSFRTNKRFQEILAYTHREN